MLDPREEMGANVVITAYCKKGRAALIDTCGWVGVKEAELGGRDGA